MPKITRFLPAAATLGSALVLSACATTRSDRGAGAPMAGSRPLTAAEAEAAVAPSLPIMKAMTQRLAADDFEGRAPSTATERRVLKYIIAEFRKAGLQPGNKGQWLQDVPTVEITGSNHAPLTVRTARGAAQSFAFGDQYVAASYRVTPQTRIADAPLVCLLYTSPSPRD